MKKIKNININQPYRNYCECTLEQQIYDDHICIYASVKFDTKDLYKIRFNSEWIPEDKLEWFGNILLSNIINIVNESKRNIKNEVQRSIQRFKSILSI